MKQFSKQLETEYGIRTFYFNPLPNGDPFTYHLSVVNGSKTHIFLMHLVVNEWIILNLDAPQWIIKLEKGLSNAILEHKPSG